jgi:hypothetical protein
MPVTTQRDLLEESSAVFSDCGAYRYRLDRRWDEKLPPLAFGMLNPSTADEIRNDATIERCERRARALGFGSLTVWNLFAYRTVSPKTLKAHHSPVGPENDEFIRDVLAETKRRGGTVIAGWGSHGIFQERFRFPIELACLLEIELYCLGVTNSGQPRHPLYVSYQSIAKKWQPEFESKKCSASFSPAIASII